VRQFWPALESAQSDYELLREMNLAGEASLSVAAQRFERRGLAGLIAWPAAEPVFSTRLSGAARPAWTPHVDPRLEALAASFELLLTRPTARAVMLEEAR
jgi:hypothetical protein